MPNLFQPLGWSLHEFMGHPALAMDAGAQLAAAYNNAGARGGAGGIDTEGLGSGSVGPYTGSFLNQALASGQPVTQMPRRPGAGIFAYGLSKLGLLHPNVAATPDELALEQRALAGQRQQQQTQLSAMLDHVTEVAKTDPQTARLMYQQLGLGGDPSQMFVGTQQGIEQERHLKDVQSKQEGEKITETKRADEASEAAARAALGERYATLGEQQREFTKGESDAAYDRATTALTALIDHATTVGGGDPTRIAQWSSMLQSLMQDRGKMPYDQAVAKFGPSALMSLGPDTPPASGGGGLLGGLGFTKTPPGGTPSGGFGADVVTPWSVGG